MKRVFALATFILPLIFVLVLSSCSDKVAAWNEKDFSFYNDKGEEIAFTTVGEPNISLSNYSGAATNRGVKIYDRATVAIEKYSFVGYGVYGIEEPALYDKNVDISTEIKKAAADNKDLFVGIMLDKNFEPIELMNFLDSSGNPDVPSDMEYWMFGYIIIDEKVSDVLIAHY